MDQEERKIKPSLSIYHQVKVQTVSFFLADDLVLKAGSFDPESLSLVNSAVQPICKCGLPIFSLTVEGDLMLTCDGSHVTSKKISRDLVLGLLKPTFILQYKDPKTSKLLSLPLIARQRNKRNWRLQARFYEAKKKYMETLSV